MDSAAPTMEDSRYITTTWLWDSLLGWFCNSINRSIFFCRYFYYTHQCQIHDIAPVAPGFNSWLIPQHHEWDVQDTKVKHPIPESPPIPEPYSWLYSWDCVTQNPVGKGKVSEWQRMAEWAWQMNELEKWEKLWMILGVFLFFDEASYVQL